MSKNTLFEDLQEQFDKSFKKLFPDYAEGENYDFSHGTVSKADAERFKEIGDIVEESFADPTVVISLHAFGLD